MADSLLSVQSLNKRFGAVQASRDLSLEVARGELHALIGPNGAGKTTAINQLCGETLPDSGQIVFDGRRITRMPAYRRAQLGMARSYQITSVFDQLTVRENLSLAVQAHHGHSFRFWRKAGSDPAVRQAVLPAMARVDLESRADVPAASLSHGEKRQLEVGMALAGRPKILLLDEPYAGMGPGGAVELTRLIQRLKTEVTILLVEHDMGAVFRLADRITVLVYGQAIASGTPGEIREDAQVRKAYLGDETPVRP
ncbi:ABC transporter ATP-binding protein [Desulfosarcina alkanivorans]|jgi:branched-chain amino acid transport system ATP-binding protein|uniref:ABC transporter ATP-binding protein n=1 Tax=Desulfosarcina alkanivorans TaxID=571177 RepID=A0A5K7YVQ8_9BACT|nr:ABC transporter ATP-binding protein [Desulfosarcina alkanivorans]BBO71151.1 ABC transporter ATP-binding protein [Desulfosarcina alkanivorans]